MIKLNLGCGKKILEGWINYDFYPINDKVKYLDLNKLPLNIKSNYADVILLQHVYEHLYVDPSEFFIDINRILKKGGILKVVLPVFGSTIKHKKTYYSKKFLIGLENPYFTNGKKYKLISINKSKRFGHIGFFYRLHKLYRFWIDLGVEQYESVFEKINE
jgi:predicted SAM-dependent methyltransferase